VNDQRLVRSAKTGVGHRYFAARRTRFLRADVRPASCICWSETESRSGGGRESNPPGGSRPHTDFEGMSDARTASRPATSVFVFGRRPRTCKDL